MGDGFLCGDASVDIGTWVPPSTRRVTRRSLKATHTGWFSNEIALIDQKPFAVRPSRLGRHLQRILHTDVRYFDLLFRWLTWLAIPTTSSSLTIVTINSSNSIISLVICNLLPSIFMQDRGNDFWSLYFSMVINYGTRILVCVIISSLVRPIFHARAASVEIEESP